MEFRALVRLVSVGTIALVTLPAFAGLMDEAQVTAQDAIFAEFRSGDREVLEISGCDLTISSLPGATVAMTCDVEGRIQGASEYAAHTCIVELKRTDRSFEALSVACALR